MNQFSKAALCVMLLGAAPAFAQSFEEALVAQLREQGYASIVVSRTWLGRLRIDATMGEARREIVINPSTGEILRDYQGINTQFAGANDGAASSLTASSSTGSGGTLGATMDTRTERVPDLMEPTQTPAAGAVVGE